MLEDRWLIKKVKAGDGRALRRIYEKYKYGLLTIAAGLLNDRPAAEDVLHDVFVSFAEDIRGFELTGSLKAYFVRCITNRAIDRLRSKENKMMKFGRVDSVDRNWPTPERIVSRSEQFQQLSSALGKLPLEQREVVILRLKAGMRFKEIARHQSSSINTIQGRYRYGIEKLRSLLVCEDRK
ncbi:MAG: RNA polymerase sigma factor [Planctomycetota bacterium]|jgi:RNA polymerase sigma-70 factor (ECF subfamily)